MAIPTALSIVCLVAAVGSAASAGLNSLCPGVFRYEPGNQTGQWEGTLTLLSDYDLHGVWARLIFDNKLSQLIVADNFADVDTNNSVEYLLKNRNYVLKAGVPVQVRLIAKYESDSAPNLIGYRLNAKVICPGQEANLVPFTGDLNNPNYLASVIASSKQELPDKPLCEDSVGMNPVYFPWQASIYLLRGDEESYLCEGSLITETHVLTAAHCLTYQQSTKTLPESQIKVYLGRRFINNDYEVNATQIYKAVKISVYPGYRPESLIDDLAVIELGGIAIVKDIVRPICLAKPENKDGDEGIIVGNEFNEEYHDGFRSFKSADIVEISPSECAKRQPDWKLLLSGGGTYCTEVYISDKGHCIGNSGSSLTQQGRNSWELRGVVIIGPGARNKNQCGRRITVLATDVSKYLRWISSVTYY